MSVAAVLTFEGLVIKEARIALGAVAPVPLRAVSVEEFLVGRKPDEETAARAGEIACAHVFPLARNGYKVQILKALLRKAILSAV